MVNAQSTASAQPTAQNPARLGSTVLGYPRIGPDRELKRALEGYWAGRLDQDELESTAAWLRQKTWRELAELGLESIPSTFSYYDHVLDTTALVGAIPARFTALGGGPLDTYFAAARGAQNVAPLELTKWFDTNYHYLVPEIGPDTAFELAGDPAPIAHHREATAAGIATRPVLVGPASFLLLAKPTTDAGDAPDGFRPLDRLDDLVEVYAQLLAALADEGVTWVQLDEPAYVTDRDDDELDALRRAYERLGSIENRPSILVASYFGTLGAALPILAAAPVEAIGLDLVSAPDIATDVTALHGVPGLSGTVVVAGVVDGRNIWRTDLDAALESVHALGEIAGEVVVGTSCSLLHVPYDVAAETDLDPRVRGWLAFAEQKVAEVVALTRAARGETDSVAEAFERSRTARRERASVSAAIDQAVRTRAAAVGDDDLRRGSYERRAQAQQDLLALPTLPTTTIGSFPQTDEVRAARAAYRAGRLDDDAYTAAMQAEIERVIRLQEKLGLDVLVHGEPERNDMVQYFAEQLVGFATTRSGWVQSYGSRCVRPPILYGDVSRPAPITVPWATYAQSLTDRPVKGMLTGPVTILAWSFVRDDQPLADTARQVALAIRDEVGDLEAAGIAIVQVDEPALRELLPLRRADHDEYLRWSVESFRLATSGAADATQVHTHLCYSEFADVIDAIDALDADVTSIEAARSRMAVVAEVAVSGAARGGSEARADATNQPGFGRGIGPGVYDIHSPRVPGADEIEALLRTAVEHIPARRLWVNPDCGLKTRRYDEVEPALTALVEATARVRG